jgi:IS30 family transposase
VALALARLYPEGHGCRVSHETLYNCIYAQQVGELRRNLIACLRHALNKRLPRSKGEDRRGQIPDMLSIHVRPPEIEDRQFPGHWEGDLIKGQGNASAVGTLVERSSRLLMLVRLPHPKPATAAHVLQAFTDKLAGVAQPMRQSMTYDRGREMALHAKLTERTGVAVYFCVSAQPLAARQQ